MRKNGEQNNDIFAKRLAYYLELKGERPIEFSKNAGIPKTTVSSWMNGERMPKMEKIEMIAKYFGISKSDLLDEKDNSYKEETISYIKFHSDESDLEFMKTYLNIDKSSKIALHEIAKKLQKK